MGVRDIVRRLGLDGPGRRELKDVLRRLIAERRARQDPRRARGPALADEPGGGPAHRQPRGLRLRGARQAGRRPRTREGDVYVSAVNMKEALHGDRVVARVERHTPKGAEGRIIRVLERGPAADRRPLRGGRPLRRPRGPLRQARAARAVHPAGRRGGRASRGRWCSAEITRPPTATRNPAGRVLEVLGRLDDPGVDLKVVMAKYGLPDAFPPEVEAEAERVPKAVGRGGHRGPHRLPRLGHRHRRPGDRARPRRRHQPRPPARRAAGGWPCTSPTWRTTCAPGSALDQEAYLRGHLRLLPRPRRAHAAARALQQHLQPGGGPGPADPDRGPGARRQGQGRARPSSTTA